MGRMTWQPSEDDVYETGDAIWAADQNHGTIQDIAKAALTSGPVKRLALLLDKLGHTFEQLDGECEQYANQIEDLNAEVELLRADARSAAGIRFVDGRELHDGVLYEHTCEQPGCTERIGYVHVGDRDDLTYRPYVVGMDRGIGADRPRFVCWDHGDEVAP